VTTAADLVSVGNFREGPTNDVTAVDFTFDVASYVVNPGGYRLVTTAGVTVNCSGPAVGSATASGTSSPGGNGTTVHTVNCVDTIAGVPGPEFSATNVARGAILAGAFSTASVGGTTNPQEAADVANSGNSDGPDLVLVVLAPDAIVNADVVGFIYDEAVAAGTNPSALGAGTYVFGGHRIYTSAGVENGAASCTRSTESNATVVCGFADGTLSAATYVGGNVRQGTVTETDGILTNGPDEVGVSPSSGPSSATGLTDGPDLTDVTINTVVSPFGNTSYTATFTFDEDTADTADAASTASDAAAAGNSSGAAENVILQLLHLYTADGIRLDCTSTGLPDSTSVLTARAEDSDNTVTCTSFIVGTAGPAATPTQIHSAVVGTVDYGAVDDETAGGDTNPEGAAVTSGGNGTPAS
jgi:hypothetical protein